MGVLAPYVPIVHTEAESLAQFLATLSADDWQRPSACELWAIQDVVAHLIWAADFYTDTVSRGLRGDLSHPEDRPPGDRHCTRTFGRQRQRRNDAVQQHAEQESAHEVQRRNADVRSAWLQR